MRKIQKMIGAAVCASMLVSVVPMNGSFTRPAIVKAKSSLKDTAYEKLAATGTGYNKLEISAKENGDLATILAKADQYKYMWITSMDADEIKASFHKGGTPLPDAVNGKIELPGPGDDVSGKSYLVVVKTKDMDFGKNGDLEIYGKAFRFEREVKSLEASLKFDQNGDITGVSGFEYKIVETDENPELGNNAAANTVAEAKKSDSDFKDVKGEVQAVTIPGKNYATYLFRKKGSGNKFASEASEKKIVRINDISLISLEYKYDPMKEEMRIAGGTIAAIFKDGDNRGEVSVKTADGKVTKFSLKEQRGKDFVIPSQGKETDQVEVYVEGDGVDQKHTFKFMKTGEKPNPEIKVQGRRLVGFGRDGGRHMYQKKGDTGFKTVTKNETETLKPGTYYVYKVPGVQGPHPNQHFDRPQIFNIKSDPVEFEIKRILSEEEETEEEELRKAEEAKKEKEAKKAEEAKKEEEAKKAEEAKKKSSDQEEKKLSIKNIKAADKTSATVSSDAVKSILTSEDGKLVVEVKNASVTLPKEVLQTILGEKADVLKVSAKAVTPKKNSKDDKAIATRLKKNKLVSERVYHISVKAGEKMIRSTDFQGAKIKVSLKTDLKKKFKSLYVMSLSNGKLMKAGVKSGNVTFKAGATGKFVLVIKK